jgi:hypothetical protein
MGHVRCVFRRTLWASKAAPLHPPACARAPIRVRAARPFRAAEEAAANVKERMVAKTAKLRAAQAKGQVGRCAWRPAVWDLKSSCARHLRAQS